MLVPLSNSRLARLGPNGFGATTLLLVVSLFSACRDLPNSPVGPVSSAPLTGLGGIPTLVVNTLLNDEDIDTPCSTVKCTLGQAAYQVPSGGMITFSSTLCAAGSSCELPGAGYQFGGQLDGNGNWIPFSAVINGPTAYSLTLQGSVTGGVSLVVVMPAATVTIRNLAITGHRTFSSGDWGGGFTNHGTLTLESVNVHGNFSHVSGGGIYNNGILVLRNSSVTDNEASSLGGGIANEGTSVTLINSDVSGNRIDPASSYGGSNYYGVAWTSLTLQKKSCIAGITPNDFVNLGTQTGTNCP